MSSTIRKEIFVFENDSGKITKSASDPAVLLEGLRLAAPKENWRFLGVISPYDIETIEEAQRRNDIEEEAPVPIEPSAGGGKLYYHKIKNIPSEFRKVIRSDGRRFRLKRENSIIAIYNKESDRFIHNGKPYNCEQFIREGFRIIGRYIAPAGLSDLEFESEPNNWIPITPANAHRFMEELEQRRQQDDMSAISVGL
jgi:hypothetical protein